ncbi:MAG TPA: TRAM domain-containing protein [Candidatus Hydrogenedens sp.]|nr:TRAM domain-containing protein [Candidatus Hydrogenedens sp.]
MVIKLVKVFFVFACIVMGIMWAYYLTGEFNETANTNIRIWGIPQRLWIPIGGLTGAIIATAVLLGIQFITQEIYERIAPALVAIVLAMVAGYFIGQYIFFWAPQAELTLRIFVMVSLVLIFGFIGIVLGLTRASNWESLISAVQKKGNNFSNVKIIDTSILIDGRIADICKSGFLEGTLLVPRFVLRELQNIADSTDILRRAKGRRGLDVLKSLQDTQMDCQIEIIEENPKDVREVDAKLVTLAKKYHAPILTTDFNLNKVAQIEGVRVLNVNDLANALKPILLPDEQMEIKVIKEGKETGQGIGYLDDGTMVVIDGGKPYLGHTINVIVTSILQTSAGRMIFTRFQSLVS